MRIIVISLAGLAIAFAIVLIVSPLTRMGLIGSEGHITTGEFLGVKIGDSATSANEKMNRHGFDFVDDYDGGECMGIEHLADIKIELYYDNSWRRGTVCIGSKEDKVVSIDWMYGLAFP